MRIQILLPEENSKEGIINLKNFIDRASIEGIDSAEINRSEHTDGQMGAGDILNSITTIIQAAEKPLVELVKCLQKFVDNYRTKITIPTEKGDIIISHGRSMKAEQLQELVVAIQKSNE
ncbi:hypothetical protein FW778_22205 [Ginsengibacter hankyongi]|uniref:Uncharacterized protein n=1 Tax=Ginsengibacter hankyongi TaxID=2607284 RepID=A0A5J5IC61_9BACT|nr:hypothetical protein [Ginsengibacter hankyongi]KAA9034552.1 hypothetical protein FW778_22205 [Ginsengibacter hankyongi]